MVLSIFDTVHVFYGILLLDKKQVFKDEKKRYTQTNPYVFMATCCQQMC